MNEFDCLVLSGGGAKGAYGAGAAKALFAYRKAKNIGRPLVFIGTSAGALNACVLAAYGPDKLYDLWAKLTPNTALGWIPRDARVRAALNMISPVEWFRIIARLAGYDFAYRLYSPSGLKALITDVLSAVDFDEFAKNAHLVIAATDYTRGEMAAFYISHLIDEFKKIEADLPHENRSLNYFIPIESKTTLVEALLASTAIPIAFPPVRIGDAHYVDGGIGNNTPTREAAMFLRYVDNHPKISNGTAGVVYTVLQQTPGTLVRGDHRLGAKGLAWRTYELFHYTQMLPVIRGWHQINRAAERHATRAKEFNEFLDGLALENETKESIRTRFNENFASIKGRATNRLSLPMIEVQPTSDLGSFLDFTPKVVASHLEHGYIGMVHTLFNRQLIEAELRDELLTNVRNALGMDVEWKEKANETGSPT
jgi:predicted acylesterase/phospholipase RssA